MGIVVCSASNKFIVVRGSIVLDAFEIIFITELWSIHGGEAFQLDSGLFCDCAIDQLC